MVTRYFHFEPDIQDALREFNTDIADKDKYQNWYTWVDAKQPEIYSNVKIKNPAATMPTESAVNTKLAELKTAYNEQNAAYKVARKAEYKDIAEQLDMMYWDKVNDTTTWQDHIAKVKSDNPKS